MLSHRIMPFLLLGGFLGLAGCNAADADRDYVRSKCQGYGDESSDAFRACANDALIELRRTQRFRTVG